MSWYSDREPFDEYEPDFCKWCKVPVEQITKSVCDECKAYHWGTLDTDEEYED